MLVFFCILVGPGRSRVIWAFPRNVGVWLHHITPWWLYHVGQNLILDSDIFLLHVEERKFVAAGLDNWYWSHVVQCRSCNAALKAMKALEATLQVASVAVVGFLAVAKGTVLTSTVQRAAVVSAAVLCFAASHWLANFIQKNFYFQDYIHAYK
ncbi:Protochlorophyllide-dependent translocon component 52, chloroplastic [Zea mays]|uniref:Protochlorophyllide-dependent translocon component 52, chloroplastic n=1 Tax=Zea mays TaxID=4577 RepID=A0A3L6FTJ4_MAIZE|nr:Protochlorophyllide-dependent translocon component 52, chloroplastic [Zea mays]